MPTRRRRARKSSPPLTRRSDVQTIEATYLTLKGEKLAQRLKDHGGRPGKAPTPMARERSLIDAFLEGFEKGKICGELEQNIEAGINFLQENGNNPALQETCNTLRNQIVEKVGIYASNC